MQLALACQLRYGSRKAAVTAAAAALPRPASKSSHNGQARTKYVAARDITHSPFALAQACALSARSRGKEAAHAAAISPRLSRAFLTITTPFSPLPPVHSRLLHARHISQSVIVMEVANDVNGGCFFCGAAAVSTCGDCGDARFCSDAHGDLHRRRSGDNADRFAKRL